MSKNLKPFYFTSNSDFPFIICPSGLRALQNILYLPDVILGIGNLKFLDLSVYFFRSILILLFSPDVLFRSILISFTFDLNVNSIFEGVFV